MKNITLAFVLVFFPQVVFSQVFIDKKFTSMTLENNMRMFRDTTNSLTIQDIINSENTLRFENIPIAAPNLGRDTNYHWIAFSLKNNELVQKNVYLQTSQPFIDFLNFYAVDSGRVQSRGVFQYEEKLKAGLLPHLARPVFEIELNPKSVTKVFIRIRNTAGVMIVGMKLLSKDEFFDETSFEHTLHTIFFGIIASFSILSIAFFVISKLRRYLYYGIYIFLINISFQGVIGNLYNMSSFKLDFINGDSCFRFYSISGLIFNVFFLRKLFEIKSKDRWYLILTNIILVLCLYVWMVTLLDLGYLYYPFSSVLNTYVFFILIALITIVYNLKRRPQTVRLYIFSFFPIILVLIVRILSEEGIIPQPISFSYYVLPAITFEFLILLVGLSKMFIKKLNEQKELETKIITSQIQTQETERKHIAQDLHDDLGATLSALKGRNMQEGFSEETQNLLNKAITDLRAISRRLLPADFEMFGFIPSVEKYIADINQQQKIKVTFIVFGEKIKLNTDKELNIYRIITELVNNSVKHSDGQNATVQLVYHKDYLFISIEDDGKTENKNENNLGIGLKNVISRLEYLSANQIEIGGQNGYSFIFEIPYQPNL